VALAFLQNILNQVVFSQTQGSALAALIWTVEVTGVIAKIEIEHGRAVAAQLS
jgi:hypothetical protein